MKTILVFLILINLSLDFAHSQNENYITRAVGYIARWVIKWISHRNFVISQKQDCVVPNNVNNAKWVLKGTQNETPAGYNVPDGTVIRAICDSSLDMVYGTKDVTKCQSGNWTPYNTICLDLSENYGLCSCSDAKGCLIPKQPDNVKWVDEETGQELSIGMCIKRNVSVTGFCKKSNYSYFGNGNFPTTKCDGIGFLLTGNFYCTDQDPKGYSSAEYCIIPKPLPNSKWLALELNKEFSAGEYVKSGTLVRVSCNTNSKAVKEEKNRYAFACREGIWHYHRWNGNSSFLDSWDYFGSGPCESYLEEVRNNSVCVIPRAPVNGVWVTWDTKLPLTPGTNVGEYARVIVKCNKGQKNFPATDVATCTRGGWTNINYFGECEPICKSLVSTDHYKVTCTVDNKISENCTEPLDGTVAEISCKSTFENLHIWESKSKLRVCFRGKWNNNALPNCIPKCGLKAPNLQPFIVGGAEVSKGGYPWHVALYVKVNETMEYICGGSLISDRLIITAAHCVAYQHNGEAKPASLFKVAVGKQFSNYSDPRDKHSQSSTIEKIFIPDAYKGDTKKLIGDIAILVTKESFNMDDKVLPICVNFGTDKLEQKLLTDYNKLGYVPGFGVTGTGNISETLKEIAVPLIRHENCSKYLPQEFVDYYSYDKFCAGLLNQSSSLCKGDSGGGLVVQNPLDNRFYLAGIVSAGPVDKVTTFVCNIQQFTLFTNVADYVDFISDKGSEYLQTKIKTRTNVRPVERESHYVKWYALGSKPDLRPSTKSIPYLALIGTKVKNQNKWFCNGNLISDRFILTAAICASNRSSPLIVRLGIDTTPNVRDFQVVETHVSPDYRPPQIYSDIALMKLSEKVEFSEFIHPAFLYKKEVPYDWVDLTRRSATWSRANGRRVDVYVSLPKRHLCEVYFKRYLADDLTEAYVNDVQFCAKPIDPFEDFLNLCDLLPGGGLPLVYYYDKGRSGTHIHRIAGLTTVLKDCLHFSDVMLFTNVSAFVPWIEEIVWPSNKEVLKAIK